MCSKHVRAHLYEKVKRFWSVLRNYPDTIVTSLQYLWWIFFDVMNPSQYITIQLQLIGNVRSSVFRLLIRAYEQFFKFFQVLNAAQKTLLKAFLRCFLSMRRSTHADEDKRKEKKRTEKKRPSSPIVSLICRYVSTLTWWGERFVIERTTEGKYRVLSAVSDEKILPLEVHLGEKEASQPPPLPFPLLPLPLLSL